MFLALLSIAMAPPAFKSWMIGPFTREDSVNPVLKPNARITFFDPMRKGQTAWRSDNVFNPAAVVRNGKLCLLFRAEDASGQGVGHHTSRIGLAESSDGLHFSARKSPVLFPANDAQKAYEWPGGCEDPRIVSSPGGYVMTYTAWDRTTARLCVATSTDLIHWKKRGPAFAKSNGGKWRDLWSKSGAIVTKRVGSNMVATKINGYYWMYFSDLSVSIASSTNLLDWTPITQTDGRIKPVLRPRAGKFDSALCESGPPAVLTPRGIVLIFNGSNAPTNGDPSLPVGTYSAGEALFDARNPWIVVERSNTPILKPERPYEVTGQYAAGTVFVEGLAWFHGHWVLAYGTADSMVAIARS